MRILILLWLALIAWSGTAGAQGIPAEKKNHLPAAHLTALDRGEQQDVIVVFKHQAVTDEADQQRRVRRIEFDDEEVLTLKARRYDAIKARALNRHSSTGFTVQRSYQRLPLTHLRVRNRAALERLANDPEVEAVHANTLEQKFLSQSLPLIHQPQATNGGYVGTGTSVAVLDTGVDYTRAAFGSCTSPGVPAGCKVAVAIDFAPNDGALDADGHGTNVAGIVLGVAPGTRILALDVFTPTGAFSTDILAAVDWVLLNRVTYNIVAVNLSLGSGQFTSPVTTSAYATPMANLRAAGVLPAVASGNNGYTNALSSPAAVVGAVSVGAVYDSAFGTYSGSCIDGSAADKVTCFSNSASFLTLLAPGAMITAAGITYAGTSQATPHVAGAAAVLRAAFPGDTVDQTVARLQNGVTVVDNRNGISKPRIDLAMALSLDLLPPSIPTGLAAVVIGYSQIDLTWAASTDNVGVTQYKVYRNSALIATLGAVTAYSDTGLNGSTSYSYTVAACDGNGNCSTQSGAVGATTGTPVAPGAPVIGTAVASNKQATISFSPPASNGGSAITSYNVTVNPGGFTFSAAGPPATITGLTNGTSYSFNVSATNLFGTGPSSATSNSVVPQPFVTTTALSSTSNPATYGGNVTFTASITGGGSTPTGSVTFMDGSVVLATQLNVTGTASLSTSALLVGQHGISAIYSGDSNNAPSTSTALQQMIAPSSGYATGVAAGASHSCAIVTGGVQCWGGGGGGRLGNNSPNGSLIPVVALPPGSGVTDLSAGFNHTCAVVAGGVSCWGDGSYGQLGVAGMFLSWVPVSVFPAGSGATAVSAGYGHSCAVINGGVQCWGHNHYGQLGSNSFADSPTPVPALAGGSGATAVAGEGYQTCAVVNGGAQCWGYNAEGELGNNSTISSPVPVTAIPAGSGVTAIASGFSNSCAVISGGAKCWGFNAVGQLGNNSTILSLIPVTAISAGSGVTAISAGASHTCAAVSGGLQCWGNNNHGQFGNNSGLFGSLVPQSIIAAGNGVTAIAAGGDHTCMLVSGVVQCMGNNTNGELGNNSTTQSIVPVTSAIIAPPVSATKLEVTGSPNPAQAGSPVTLTATVSGGINPAGTVTFKDGNTTLGTSALASGIASFSTNALTAGSHSVYARYTGDVNSQPSTSGALVLTINPIQYATATVISSPLNPSTFGSLVTFTASVNGGSILAGLGGPTGMVTFMAGDGITVLAVVSLSGNTASYSTNLLGVGSNGIGAVYSGDANNAASTSIYIVQNVVSNLAATSATLTASPNPSVFGAGVTFTATIGGGNGPTGTVTFKDGATTLGTAAVVGAAASLTTSALSVGSHSITAVYGGDGANQGSTSGPLVQAVSAGPAITTTVLASSANPATFGSSVVLTATIGGASTPTGVVTFKDGSATLGTAAVSGTIAQLTVASPSVGGHAITALYSGDAINLPSTSGVYVQSVIPVTASAKVVAAGQWHSCVVVSGGVQCWGRNIEGQLGNGSTTTGYTPVVAIRSGSGVTSVVAGSYYTCAFLSGEVRCWGSNTQGQFGNGTTASSLLPVTVATGLTAIAAGGDHACAIVSGGVQCWGGNGAGQLGNGTTTSSLSPVTAIPPGSGVVAIAAGGQHSCALADGGVRCWGEGTWSPTTVIAVGAGASFVAVEERHACAVVSGGVQCWGRNAEGQLGNGGTTDSFISPVIAVASSSSATSVAVGETHSCAVIAGGVKCWGNNGSGQLGNNSVTSSSNPVTTIAIGGGAMDITAGYGHSCAFIGNGVKCWGDGFSGQLGVGCCLLSATPVSVPLIVPSVAATATVLTSSLNPATSGNSVTLTVTVTVSGGASPTGTVTFLDGAVGLGAAAVASGGVAVLSTNGLSAGSHSITAVYGGDANNAASTSGVLVQNISASFVTTTTFNVSATSIQQGGTLAFTGAVSGGQSPGGTISFRTSGSVLATIPLAGGGASYSTNTLAAGYHGLTARYDGDTNNGQSTSVAIIVNIIPTPRTGLGNGTGSGLRHTVVTGGGVITAADIQADFNGDGRSDLFWRNSSTGENYIALMDGAAWMSDSAYFNTVPVPWKIAGYGDFDGDGKADVLWRNSATGENYVFLMDGANAKAGSAFTNTVAAGWSVAGIGDFDGDGKADIYWRNSSTGENYIALMDGAVWRSTSGYFSTVASPWAVAGFGDFDGDGKTDVLWRNALTGASYIFLLDGTGFKGGSGYSTTVALTWGVAGVGDFDGDGRSDILWRNATTGENYISLMNGIAWRQDSAYFNTIAPAWSVAATGDYDGDGKVDVLWRNATTGENYLSFMNGPSLKADSSFTQSVAPAWNAAVSP